MRPDARYQDALGKISARIGALKQLHLSLPMRIAACNVFVLSFVSFLNRFFVMPGPVSQQIMELVRCCRHLFRCKVRRMDVYLQNLSQLFATSVHFGRLVDTRPLDVQGPRAFLSAGVRIAFAVLVWRIRVGGEDNCTHNPLPSITLH